MTTTATVTPLSVVTPLSGSLSLGILWGDPSLLLPPCYRPARGEGNLLLLFPLLTLSTLVVPAGGALGHWSGNPQGMFFRRPRWETVWPTYWTQHGHGGGCEVWVRRGMMEASLKGKDDE